MGAAMPRFVGSLAVVELGEISELVRIPLMKLGRWVKGNLKFAITRADAGTLLENFRKRQSGELVIDYDHASEFPELAKGQPIPAAGWLREIDDEPDAQGVLWGKAEFTQRAREMIAAKEYKYISPGIDWGVRDKVSGEQQGATLTHVALLNRPFFDMLPAVQLSEQGWVADATEREVGTMAVKQLILADRAASKVRVVLEDGTETVLSVEGLTPEPKVVQLSDVKRDKEGRLDFSSLPHEQGTLIAGEVFHAQQVQAELDAAVKDGKITPAQRPHYEKLALSDLAGFRDLMKTMKSQIDLSERGIGGGGGEGGDLAKVDRQIDEQVKAKLAANKDQSYGQAFKAVLSEHPDLAKRRAELMRE
jgi:phage I-like protein